MPKLLGAKTGELSIGKALAIAGAKVLTERGLSLVVGNGSIFSGGTKLAGAYLVNSMIKDRYGVSNVIATAMTVDGAEDLVASVFPKISGGLFGDVKAGGIEVI